MPSKSQVEKRKTWRKTKEYLQLAAASSFLALGYHLHNRSSVLKQALAGPSCRP